jgi:hypothetical protein
VDENGAVVQSLVGYDPATGAAVKTITDVDTSRTADFTGLPDGWGSPAPTVATALARFDFGTATSAVDSLPLNPDSTEEVGCPCDGQAVVVRQYTCFTDQ